MTTNGIQHSATLRRNGACQKCQASSPRNRPKNQTSNTRSAAIQPWCVQFTHSLCNRSDCSCTNSSTAIGNTASSIRTVQWNIQLDARDPFGIVSAFTNSGADRPVATRCCTSNASATCWATPLWRRRARLIRTIQSLWPNIPMSAGGRLRVSCGRSCLTWRRTGGRDLEARASAKQARP
jgi:hypothetical protein